MFTKFFKLKKHMIFSQFEWDEVNVFTNHVHNGEYTEISKLDRNELIPEENGYDSLKLLFHLIAACRLEDITESIDIFRQLVFGDGLVLYEEREQNYLKFYAHNLMKGAFGEKLKSLPQDIQEYDVECPKFNKVSENLKQLFILQINQL